MVTMNMERIKRSNAVIWMLVAALLAGAWGCARKTSSPKPVAETPTFPHLSYAIVEEGEYPEADRLERDMTGLTSLPEMRDAPLTIDAPEVPLDQALRLFAKEGHINIVSPQTYSQLVHLKAEDEPLNAVFVRTLRPTGFGVRVRGNVLSIIASEASSPTLELAEIPEMRALRVDLCADQAPLRELIRFVEYFGEMKIVGSVPDEEVAMCVNDARLDHLLLAVADTYWDVQVEPSKIRLHPLQ